VLQRPGQVRPELALALDKVMGACAKAEEQGIKWLWVDTFCIDKRHSQKLTDSLNSMFERYKKADVCYAYVYDVDLSTLGRRGSRLRKERSRHGSNVDGRCRSSWRLRTWSSTTKSGITWVRKKS